MGGDARTDLLERRGAADRPCHAGTDPGRRPPRADTFGDRGDPSHRCRVGRGAPRRGGRAPSRGAVRFAAARHGGHGHRTGADRRADGLGRQRGGDAGPRHRVRGADDHHERHCRVVTAAGFAPLRRDVVQPARQRCGAGHAHHAGDAEPGAADLHHHPWWSGSLAGAARIRRRRRAAALPAVRFHSDGGDIATSSCPSRRKVSRASSTRKAMPSRRATPGRCAAWDCTWCCWPRSCSWRSFRNTKPHSRLRRRTGP